MAAYRSLHRNSTFCLFKVSAVSSQGSKEGEGRGGGRGRGVEGGGGRGGGRGRGEGGWKGEGGGCTTFNQSICLFA